MVIRHMGSIDRMATVARNLPAHRRGRSVNRELAAELSVELGEVRCRERTISWGLLEKKVICGDGG